MSEIALVHRLQAAPSYQERPELELLKEWWREPHPGACTLVGLGGAGKTAIAERFLSEVSPDALSVFVYSFYEQPVAEAFFRELDTWVRGAPTESDVSHFEVMAALSRSERRRLLVLDGLERVQNDGARGGVLGEIDDVPLRDLLMRVAAGSLRNTAILTTTRFPVTPLEVEKPPRFRRIDVGALPEIAAAALIRARGVGGSDEEIRAIVAACGAHALLVDLTGSCIATFGEEIEPVATSIEEALLAALRADRRDVARLQLRFARLAERYRQQLESKHPEAWEVLKLACAFRHGVREETLLALRASQGAQVLVTFEVEPELAKLYDVRQVVAELARNRFFGEVSEPTYVLRLSAEGGLEIAPAELARVDVSSFRACIQSPIALRPSPHFRPYVEGWVRFRVEEAFRQAKAKLLTPSGDPASDSEPVRRALHLLSSLGLVDARGGRVLVHPVVRESFRDERSERSAHRRALLFLKQANLSGAPRSGQVDDAAATEELVHHMIGAGEIREAWSFYRKSLGGFLALGARGAQYARGDAILRMFVHDESPARAPEPALEGIEVGAFLNEWGLYLHHLGRLSAAAACFHSAAAIATTARRPWQAAIALQNLADTQALQGRLPAARASLVRATEVLHGAADPPQGMRPEELYARDSRRDLIPSFIEAGWRTRPIATRWTEAPLPDLTLEAALARAEWADAERLCQLALAGATLYYQSTTSPIAEESTSVADSVYHAHLRLCLAEIAREQGRLEDGVEPLRLARSWALHHADRELLARAHLEESRLALENLRRGVASERDVLEPLGEGLRLARDSDFGILAIDLFLVRAELALVLDRVAAAIEDIATALGGSPGEGWLGAADPACGYKRGELRARDLAARMYTKSGPTG